MLVGLPWEVDPNAQAYQDYYGYNRYQFASPDLAQQMAQATGSKVVMTEVLGPIHPPPQALLDFGAERLNAGLVADLYTKYAPEVADAVIRANLAASGTPYAGIQLPQETMESSKEKKTMATNINTAAGTTTVANAAGVPPDSQVTSFPTNLDSLLDKLQEESPLFGLKWWMVIGAVAAGFWYLEKKG